VPFVFNNTTLTYQLSSIYAPERNKALTKLSILLYFIHQVPPPPHTPSCFDYVLMLLGIILFYFTLLLF
jgi:hypothetical protein